jgi:O-6-methylguanine DNA methyltransferase
MDKSLTEFEKEVLAVLRRVPAGRVTTYKEIAMAVGRSAAVRAVGNALNKNPYAPAVPCHRVVRSDGSVGGYAKGTKKKIGILRKEGVMVEKGKVVNFKKVLYKF